MNRPIRLIGLAAFACILSACAKAPTPAPAPNPVAAQEEEITNMNLPEPAPAMVAEDAAMQARTLAAHIEPRPECAEFLQPLAAAGKAAPGAPESKIDMADIMQRAQAAGCTRK